MKLSVRFLVLSVILAGALVLTACGGGGGGASGGGALNIGSDGENLAYSPATLTVGAGQTVKITFKNNSAAQQHNWVLLNGGDDVAAKVDEEALAAGDAAGYIPADKSNIIANTKMLAPGASETLEFTAPAAGTYTFICTYPAHYAGGMKGTLTVN